MILAQKRWILWGRILSVACLYYVAARLNLLVALESFTIPIFWALSGTSLVIFIVGGRRFWPAVFLGSFATFLFSSRADLLPATFHALIMAACNTSEPLIGYYLYDRYMAKTPNPLHRVNDIFSLLIIVVIMCCLNAFGAAIWASASGAAPWESYRVNLCAWWLSGILGSLTVLLLYWSFFPDTSMATNRLSIGEFCTFLLFLVGCNSYLFAENSSAAGHRPFSFLLIPLVVWAAIRFKRLGVIVSALVTSSFGIWGTINALGPFANIPPDQGFLFLHIFLDTVTITGMILCASMKERIMLIQKLERVQNRFKLVIESSPHSIIIINQEGRMELVNKMAERMFGYSHTELTGQPINMLLPERFKSRPQELNFFSPELSQKDGQDAYALRKDHTEIPIEVGLNPIEIEGKMFVLVSISDISQRKQAEQSLRENELYFRTMADNAPVMIWMTNALGEPVFFNKGWLNFTGRTLSEELSNDWEKYIHPEDLQRVLKTFTESFKLRKLFTIDFRFRRSDRTFRWILNTSVPHIDLNGQFLGYIGSCIDITTMKEAQEVLSRDKEMLGKIIEERSLQLLQTKKDLEMINRLADIGTLAATVAHELRNPLGVIEMASYNLRRKNPAFADDKHLLNIMKKVQESNRIINNLLNYSRIKRPKFEMVKVCAILDECIQTVRERIEGNTGIKVSKKYPDDADLLIEADPYQLKEIFYNILTNAHQALEKNTGEIAVSLTEFENVVEITVEDTGVGIEPVDLQRIFEPFFTRKSKGTGLGLAICNDLVTFHKGKICIESQPKIGTSVKITLPKARSSYARENSAH